MRDGRVLARHHYGFAHKAAGKRVDERSIFHWGSMYFDPMKRTAVLVAFNTTMQRSTPGARAAQRAMIEAALGLLK